MRIFSIGIGSPKSKDAMIGPNSVTIPESSLPIRNIISFAAALAASIRCVPWTTILPSLSIIKVALGLSSILIITSPLTTPPSLSTASSRSTRGVGVKRTSRFSTRTSMLLEPTIITPPLHPMGRHLKNSLHAVMFPKPLA